MLAGDIHVFLEDKKQTALLGHLCPNEIIEAIEALKGKVDMDSWDQNGWQWDWWVRATYKKQKLRLSGSGYYGNSKIEKVESWDY